MSTKNNVERKLSNLREKVDKVDDLLLELLVKRQKLVAKIGSYKRQNNLEIISKNREKFIMQKQLNLAKEKNIDSNLIKSIYKLIFKHSRKIQRGI